MDRATGNWLIFFMFKILNCCLFVVGVGVFAISIWLFALTKHFNMFNCSFILIAIAICCLSVWSWQMKKSPYTLCLYLVIVFSLFIVEFLLTIALLVNRADIVDWAVSNSDEDTQDGIQELEKLMNSNIKMTSYVLLGTSLLTLAIFQIGWWYRTTLILRAMGIKYKRLSDMGSELELNSKF
ncbi:unnamed protein product [Moneuplotes crassus]|uniref:Uncharacterized protein n=1 Tax=Euplotes crassus TaxID=5936 RepID=A0AAD1XW39_EUPCR|nr:unnamed protein product [Moneuplotes crassus]